MWAVVLTSLTFYAAPGRVLGRYQSLDRLVDSHWILSLEIEQCQLEGWERGWAQTKSQELIKG